MSYKFDTEILGSSEPEIVTEDTNPFFAPTPTGVVDTLVAQYRAERMNISKVATVMKAPEAVSALAYFVDALDIGERHFSTSRVLGLFNEDAAVAALNASYWSKAIALTDVLDLMPQARRNEWHTSIREHKTPEFTEETVRATLESMLLQRETFFAERVDGIFRALSKTHVTNQPEGFGKRMILSGAFDVHGYVSSGVSGVINDLRCVIARFMGRVEPRHGVTSHSLKHARNQRGQWITLDGGALRIRCYQAGTAHLEIHPSMVYRLNSVLAHLYPTAIPSKFREAPKRKPKDYFLAQQPLPFAVLELLQDIRPSRKRVSEWPERYETLPNTFYMGAGSHSSTSSTYKEAARVMTSIGGSQVTNHTWEFDYNPLDVIGTIVASGCVPEDKSHQFYATPEELADDAAITADVQPGQTVLEPQAGTGGLADRLPKDQTKCVEVSALRAKILKAKGYDVDQADFITWADSHQGQFDHVVMNPPFSEGRWQAHTEAAMKCLKPGGKLTAILPASANIKGATVHRKYSDVFAGTSVTVILVSIVKN